MPRHLAHPLPPPLAANALTTLVVLAVGAFDARAKAGLNL